MKIRISSSGGRGVVRKAKSESDTHREEFRIEKCKALSPNSSFFISAFSPAKDEVKCLPPLG